MIKQNKIEINLPEGVFNTDIYNICANLRYKPTIEEEVSEILDNEESVQNRLQEISFIRYIGGFKLENGKIEIRYVIEKQNPQTKEEYGKELFMKYFGDKIQELKALEAIDIIQNEARQKEEIEMQKAKEETEILINNTNIT